MLGKAVRLVAHVLQQPQRRRVPAQPPRTAVRPGSRRSWRTIRTLLTRRAGTYMVTDVEGNGPKSIGIVSSSANLAPHVGHKIEVTGTAVPPKEAETDAKVPKAPHYMKLTAIKMISATCP